MFDLFGKEYILPMTDKSKGDRTAKKQYRTLINVYGKVADKKCKQCEFAKRHQAGSKTFYKCHKAKVSSSQSTDWNSLWIACGLFTEKK